MKSLGKKPDGLRLERIKASPLWAGESFSQPAPDQADSSPIATTMNIDAARLTLDFWRNVYTPNDEVLQLPNGNAAGLTAPSVSLWTPCAVGRTC